MKFWLITLVAVSAVGCSGGGTVVRTQPVQPPLSTLSNDQTRIYTTNVDSTIRVYDEAGNPVKSPGGFPNTVEPSAIIYDALDRLLYVTDQDGLKVYDTNGNQIVSCSIPISGIMVAAFQTAFDSSNRLLYVLGLFKPVSVYDQAGHEIVPSGGFQEIRSQSAIAFVPANHRLYVASTPYSLAAYDENGYQIKLNNTNFNLYQLTGMAFDPFNHLLYVTDYEPARTGRVTALTLDGQQVTLSGNFPIPTLDQPNSIAFDPSNRLLYVTFAEAIRVFDENGNPVARMGTFPHPVTDRGGFGGIAVAP